MQIRMLLHWRFNWARPDMITVVSRDAKSRPGKLSVREACEELGIRCMPMHEWLVLIGERTVGDAIRRKLKL